MWCPDPVVLKMKLWDDKEIPPLTWHFVLSVLNRSVKSSDEHLAKQNG